MGHNIAVICSEFNSELTSKMLMRAKTLCRNYNLNISYEVLVPGVFDMPLFIDKAMQKEDVKGVVLLGCVIKGDTDHDVVVTENTARIAANLSVKYSKPVSLGIIGPNASEEFAKDRADRYASRAVKAIEALLKENAKI